MARGIRTIWPRGLNKGFSPKFQRISPEEGRSLQRPKHREHGNKDEDNRPKNVNNEIVAKLHLRNTDKC